MLIMRRIWIVIEIPPFIAFAYPHIDDQLYELYEDLEIMNICLFFFLLEKRDNYIYCIYVFVLFFFFTRSRRFFSFGR